MNNGSFLGAAALLAATSLASRFLGLMRDRMLSSTFGAGPELDAYFTAFKIPDMVYAFVVLGALSAGFIPLFLERYKNNKETAWKFSTQILLCIGLVLSVLSVIGIVLAEPLMTILAPGFNSEVQEQAATISRIMYVSTFLLGLSGVFGGILQSMKRFAVFAVAPLFYNIGIIGGIFLAQIFDLGIMSVSYGVAAGAFMHFSIQFVGAWKCGFRTAVPRPLFDSGIKDLFELMVPRIAALAMNQANIVALTVISSYLAAGSVSIFNLTNNIQ